MIVTLKEMAKNYSGKTAVYKALIADMEAAMNERKEATDAQKKKILAMLGPLAAHVSAPVCESDSESESDSDESDSESDSDESDSDSESDSESDECDGGECRSYKKGPRAKGRDLFKKNGGTEKKWRMKSDKFKDNYYEKYKGKKVEVA